MGIARARGRAAESLAAAYLELAGLEVLARNVRLGGVEVDALALDRGVRVIVEVKFRIRGDYGGAAAAVDHGKRERLRRAAATLVAQGHPEVRIDVVTIEPTATGADVRHHRGAVEG